MSVFLKDETGAVSLDWAVITAAVLGIGVAGTVLARSGVDDLSANVQTNLAAELGVQTVARPVPPDQMADRIAATRWQTGSTQQQVAMFYRLADPSATPDAALLAEHSQWVGLAGDTTYTYPEMAEERLALIEAAMEARGLQR